LLTIPAIINFIERRSKYGSKKGAAGDEEKSCAIFCIGLYSMQGAVARRHWPEPAHNVSNLKRWLTFNNKKVTTTRMNGKARVSDTDVTVYI
jgi:hypothetical protein